jgi:HAD superfamily hydrolase (TIGR01490 family)
MSAAGARAETAGAFFDLDGTLLPAPSLEWRFVGYLLARDEITTAQVGGWLAELGKHFWHDVRGATLGNKRYLAGSSEGLVHDWEKLLAPAFFGGTFLPFFEEALQRIAWHHARGDRVFLVSGTLAPLARVVARSIAAYVPAEIEVAATELETAVESPRVWSGRIAGEHMSGGAKQRAVRKLAARHGLDLSRSYAYGDSAGDLGMLEAVGNAVAVNPTRFLARAARKRGWQACVWKSTLGDISNEAARQVESKAAR